MSKQPYIPLYIGDWEQDVNGLSIEAEGAWLKIVFKCWRNEGSFTATPEMMARICKVSTEKFATILLEWKLGNICEISEHPDGLITVLNRRITKECEISKIRQMSGSKGGSKTSSKRVAKQQQNTDNDNEYDIGIRKGVQGERFNAEDFYSSAKVAFEEIKNDESLIERITMMVHGAGYRSVGKVDVIQTIKRFLVREGAKDDFTRKPKREIKNYLINWISKNSDKVKQNAA